MPSIEDFPPVGQALLREREEGHVNENVPRRALQPINRAWDSLIVSLACSQGGVRKTSHVKLLRNSHNQKFNLRVVCLAAQRPL